MIQLGLITLGHIHTPGFVRTLKSRATEIHVAGLFDPDTALAEKYAAELGAPIAKHPDAILGDPSITAVVISGNTAQHNEYLLPTIAAKKNVFVEKPLAITSADALKFYTAIKESGVIFQTGHFMRSDPIIRFVKAEIDAGNLGTITRARHTNCHTGALGGWFDKDYRWFFQADKAGGGGFYDLGCHSLDILVYLFGAVHEVTAAIGGQQIKYPAIDEYGEGLIRFKNQVIGSVAAGWVDHANPANFHVSGTEGHLYVNNGQVFYKSSKTKVPGADGNTPIDSKHFPAGLPHAFDLFFDVLLGKQDKSNLVPIEDALTVARAMDSMYLAQKLGSWVKV